MINMKDTMQKSFKDYEKYLEQAVELFSIKLRKHIKEIKRVDPSSQRVLVKQGSTKSILNQIDNNESPLILNRRSPARI